VGSAFSRVELEVHDPHLGRDISLRQPDSNRCRDVISPTFPGIQGSKERSCHAFESKSLDLNQLDV
jgi:hypothetical protein